MTGPLLLRGDARALPLADESVDVVVTSPPYFGLRDYGTDGQIGAEPTPREFVAALIAVAVCATLAGAKGFTAIGQWAAEHGIWVLTAEEGGAAELEPLGITPTPIPS